MDLCALASVSHSCDFAATQNSDSEPAIKNSRAETSTRATGEATKRMEEMSELYHEKGERLYPPE